MWKYCEKNIQGVKKCEITVWKPKEYNEKEKKWTKYYEKMRKKWSLKKIKTRKKKSDK